MFLPRIRSTHLNSFLLIVFIVSILLVLGVLNNRVVVSPNAASAALNPTRLAAVYVVPKNVTTSQEYSAAEIAQKFQVVIYHRQFSQKVSDYRNAGFQGDALQYILHDETAGPMGMRSVAAQNTVCTTAQKAFQPEWHNSITFEVGEFCRIHDSSVTHTPFDHDLNPATAAVAATEDWFLHRGDTNERITQPEGMPNGEFYRLNPANQRLREYFTAMALREIKGTATHPKTNFDGVYLDNVQLSWRKVKRNILDAPLKEYSSTTTFANDVHSFVTQMHTAFSADGIPLWGNVIEGDNDGFQWDKYTTALDGGLLEDFALNWGRGYHSDQTIINQLNQAEKWVRSGKSYVAVAQGQASNPNHLIWGKFALAASLLVTDGTHVSFHLANATNYSAHYDLPEYYYKLGRPLEDRQTNSTNPLIYSRQFECGYVEVNVTTKANTIVATAGCTPTVTSSPPVRKRGDVNQDTVVNLLDYTLLFESYGYKTGDQQFNQNADFVGGIGGTPDGVVNILDYTVLFENFGR